MTMSLGEFMIYLLKRSFDISGRMGRKQYWISQLVVLVLSLTLIFVDYCIKSKNINWGNLFTENTLPILFCIGFICGIKRMHDIDKSGLFFLIPLVSIVLCIFSGTSGENRYGIDHKCVSSFQIVENENVLKGNLLINKNFTIGKIILGAIVGFVSIFIISVLSQIIQFYPTYIHIYENIIRIPLIVLIFGINVFILSISIGFSITFIINIMCFLLGIILINMGPQHPNQYEAIRSLEMTLIMSSMWFFPVLALKIYSKIKKPCYSSSIIFLLIIHLFITLIIKIGEILTYPKGIISYLTIYYPIANIFGSITNSFLNIYLLCLWVHILKRKTYVT